jgi:predicted porin
VANVSRVESARIEATRFRKASGGSRQTLAKATCGLAVAAICAAAAPSLAADPNPAAGETLSWKGITLYGIVDVGIQYDTHGAPFSDYFPASSADIVQKNSNKSIWGVTSNNLSQSRIGLNGTEPLNLIGIDTDLAAVFKMETFFNPSSGNISDALKSLTQNNGRALANQTTNLDSSIAGQPFQQLFAGFTSPTYGSLTFGRQNTLLADGIAKYDPNAASQAFSLIGLSGTTAGGGDTQERRLDNSLKYVFNYMGAHAGAMYKFSNSSTSANSAYQFTVGGEYAGASVDAYYAKAKSAIAAGALSAAQLTDALAAGFNPDKSVVGTVTDNTAFSLQGLYSLGPIKLFAGYENIKYQNPSNPLPVGFDDIGGYKLAVVNNTSLPHEKIQQVFWGGVKYAVLSNLDLTAAYYGYHQSAFAVGANAGCDTSKSAQCAGNLHTLSFDAVYRMSKHFDGYAGLMWTNVQDGLANGYLFSRTNIDPTLGVRFRF